jgi:hypothetical protein
LKLKAKIVVVVRLLPVPSVRSAMTTSAPLENVAVTRIAFELRDVEANLRQVCGQRVVGRLGKEKTVFQSELLQGFAPLFLGAKRGVQHEHEQAQEAQPEYREQRFWNGEMDCPLCQSAGQQDPHGAKSYRRRDAHLQ